MARWLRFLVASALAGCGPGPADAPEGPASMEPEALKAHWMALTGQEVTLKPRPPRRPGDGR